MDCFQTVCMPTPSSAANGNIGMMKNNSKIGGPTEILPIPSASTNNGYGVPTKTIAAATTSKRLLSNRNVSRDMALKPAAEPIDGARMA